MQVQATRPSDKTEEVLEAFWIELYEGNRRSLPVDHPSLRDHAQGLAEAIQLELARVDADTVTLTTRGLAAASQTVRRHRLAELLLTSVLQVPDNQMELAACGIEHSLREGVEEAVCTLLGHPERCPHGKPIPPGDCCRQAARDADRAVAPLAKLYPGQKGRIAYVQTGEAKKLQKLMAMGVLPGKELQLIQGFPSYVFQVGHSQFAVDEEMARTIFVRIG